jgi:hypothetical protein
MEWNWIEVGHDRAQWRALVNTVMNFWIPQKAGHLLTRCDTISFSRRNLLHGVG